jgi:hypothetical protein
LNGSGLAKEFARRWQERYKQRAAIPFGRAGKFFKDRLQDGYEPSALISIMDFFFNRFSDSFCSRRGYDFVAFSGTFNALVIAWSEDEKKRAAAAAVEENFKRLEDARGKTGG